MKSRGNSKLIGLCSMHASLANRFRDREYIHFFYTQGLSIKDVRKRGQPITLY